MNRKILVSYSRKIYNIIFKIEFMRPQLKRNTATDILDFFSFGLHIQITFFAIVHVFMNLGLQDVRNFKRESALPLLIYFLTIRGFSLFGITQLVVQLLMITDEVLVCNMFFFLDMFRGNSRSGSKGRNWRPSRQCVLRSSYHSFLTGKQRICF